MLTPVVLPDRSSMVAATGGNCSPYTSVPCCRRGERDWVSPPPQFMATSDTTGVASYFREGLLAGQTVTGAQLSEILDALHQRRPPNPYDRHEYWGRPELSRHLKVIRSLPNVTVTVAGLEMLDDASALSLEVVLEKLPLETLQQAFGEETPQFLVWMNNLCRSENWGRRIRVNWAGLTGGDVACLARASHMRGTEPTFSTKNVLQTYRYLFALHHQALLDRVDLAALLRASTLPGISLKDKRVEDYSLVVLRPRNNKAFGPEETWGGGANDPSDPAKIWWIYCDAPCVVGLMYKERPTAVLAFRGSDTGVMRIGQYQGESPWRKKPGEPTWAPQGARGLIPFDWKRLLVELGIAIARLTHTNRVIIQGANNNRWTKPGAQLFETTIHLPLEQALKIYDATAERLGFKLADDGDWSLDL